jgi:hypothetical protein
VKIAYLTCPRCVTVRLLAGVCPRCWWHQDDWAIKLMAVTDRIEYARKSARD